MLGSRRSIDDDDNAAKLMPNVAKLIREDSFSLESNGSTSMSLCGISGKGKIETQNAKPSRQLRAETVLRDVANRFLRRGATDKRSIGACKPTEVDMLGSYYRRDAYLFDKENLRPKASTEVKHGTLPIIQQEIAMRDTSQKAAREFRKIPTRSVVKLGQRRTVNPKIQGADKSNTDMVPEHLAKHAATVTLPNASHSSQGSEGLCYVSNLAAKRRRGQVKLYTKSTPLSLSDLQEKFAELDGEALEEEEVSIAHLTTIRPVLARETVSQHADDISENAVEIRKDLSRCEREDEVSATVNPFIEEAAVPNYSHELGREGTGICTSQSKLSNTPGRDQGVQVSKPTCKGNGGGNVVASAGTNCDGITRSEKQPNPSVCRNWDDPKGTSSKANFSSQASKRSSRFSSKVAAQQQYNVRLHRKVEQLEISEQQNTHGDEVDIESKEGLSVHPTLTKPVLLSGVVSQHTDGDEQDSVRCRNEGNPQRFEQGPASPSVNGMEDKTRTADTETPPIPFDATAQDFSEKGTSVCTVFELGHAGISCDDKRGAIKLFSGKSSLKPNEEIYKEMTTDGADPNASNQEDAVFRHTSTFREDVHSAPSKAKRLLEQGGAPDVPLQEGTRPTRGTSATPPRNPLLLTCLHYSRIGRSTDMSQRRLVFDSSSESLSRQRVVDRNSDDVSVSTVEFRGRIDPAIDVPNPAVHEYDAIMTSISHQEAKLPFTDDEVIGHVNGKGCTSQSSKSKTATHCEGLVGRATSLTGSLVRDDNLPAFEASMGVVRTDPGIDSLDPQAIEVPKARILGKRTWANLGDPIDGGTEWKKGRRVSTRIKSRPLDWWRGERMLYGRVHRTLCTLIGIKTTSPDPIWPRPKPQRGDYNIRNFHVDSFVGDSHRDLLRLAAQ